MKKMYFLTSKVMQPYSRKIKTILIIKTQKVIGMLNTHTWQGQHRKHKEAEFKATMMIKYITISMMTLEFSLQNEGT
jgi:hypothetical protein